MKRVLQIVDSVEYVENNCYQHQLLKKLREGCDLQTVELALLKEDDVERAEVIVSCLKQRTLTKHASSLRSILRDRPLRVYDQDPWEAFRDDGEFKGSYAKIAGELNVEFFVVASRWWSSYVQDRGYSAKFVRIWILPEYCSFGELYVNRSVNVGFIGGVHGYRRQFFDRMANKGVHIDIRPSVRFGQFLSAMRQTRVFLHTVDLRFPLEGNESSLKKGMWAKEVDACSQGCFSIRESDPDSDSFFTPNEVPTARFFDHEDQVHDIIDEIGRLEPEERQMMIERTVEFFRTSDKWSETVKNLVD